MPLVNPPTSFEDANQKNNKNRKEKRFRKNMYSPPIIAQQQRNRFSKEKELHDMGMKTPSLCAGFTHSDGNSSRKRWSECVYRERLWKMSVRLVPSSILSIEEGDVLHAEIDVQPT